MIEVLDDLDLLARPHLDLNTVTVGGVALGAPALSVARPCIVQALAPVVARYRGGTDVDSEYYDSAGRRLALDEVIDHTARSDGFLYCADKITYKIRAATVVGFAILGRHLSHFAHLTSYEDFLAVFGTPDRSQADEAYSDLMGHINYYWSAQKCVRWDEWNHRVSLINLGDFEGNRGPVATI